MLIEYFLFFCEKLLCKGGTQKQNITSFINKWKYELSKFQTLQSHPSRKGTTNNRGGVYAKMQTGYTNLPHLAFKFNRLSFSWTPLHNQYILYRNRNFMIQKISFFVGFKGERGLEKFEQNSYFHLFLRKRLLSGRVLDNNFLLFGTPLKCAGAGWPCL